MSNEALRSLRRLALLISILTACLSSQAQGLHQETDTMWGLPLPGNRPQPLGVDFAAERASVYPSLARDGTLYFTSYGKNGGPPPRKRMARAEPEGDGYGDAMPLTGGINDSDLRVDDPWVDPDERFPSISPDGRLLTWVRSYGPSFGPAPTEYWWVSTDGLGLPS